MPATYNKGQGSIKDDPQENVVAEGGQEEPVSAAGARLKGEVNVVSSPRAVYSRSSES